MKAITLASLAAIAVQPFVFVMLFVPDVITGRLPIGELPGLMLFSVYAAIVATPFVLLIGIPSLLLSKRLGRLSWRTLGSTGFIAAVALPAFLFWPRSSPGSWSKGDWHGRSVDFVVNGEHTIYGWLRYLEGVLWFGLHGFIGALVFFFVWRRFSGKGNTVESMMRRDAV